MKNLKEALELPLIRTVQNLIVLLAWAVLLSVPAAQSQICIDVRVTNFTQTVNHNLCDTNCVTLAVRVTGTAPIHYQWYFDSRALRYQTNATLRVCNIGTNDAGNYTVVITNRCSETNVTAHLNVYEDTRPPSITCPASMRVVSCTTNGVNVSFPSPTFKDDYPAELDVVCVPPAGSNFPIGNTRVNCTATDGCGNSDRCSFVISVISDLFPPAIQCPPDITLQNCGTNTVAVNFPPPTTLDDYDTNLTVICSPANGSSFSVGTTTVTCQAVDHCKRVSVCHFKVTVLGDTSPPQITCPNDFTVGSCSVDGVRVSYPLLSAVDDTDAKVTITCSPTNGSLFQLGPTGVRCTATDNCGLRDFCSFTVTVVLETNKVKPTIGGIVPALLTTQGGNSLVITGTHFGVADKVLLNNQALIQQVWLDSTKILGVTPPLPSGIVTVTVQRCSSQVADLANAGVAAPPPQLFTVEPSKVFARGGGQVLVRGANLRPETQFFVALPAVGAGPNLLQNVTVAADGLSALGTVPPLPAGQLYGPRALKAQDTRGEYLLEAALTYIPNPIERDPQVLSLRQLEQVSLHRPRIVFKKGFPANMSMRVTMPGGSAEERARNFFRSYKELLKQPNPDTDLWLRKVRLSPGGLENVRFTQNYQGIPVYGGEILITLKGPDVRLTAGELLPPARLAGLNITPTLNAGQAEALARTLWNVPAMRLLQPTRLVVFDMALLQDVR